MLTKPGIVMGNVITTAGGFALAMKGPLDFPLFLATLGGLSLIVGSACIFNNYIDRVADAKMARTKNRPMARGLLSTKKAILFALILGFLGTFLLWTYTNPLTALVGLTGFAIYVLLYSFWKYHTIYGTAIGSLAGAVPPVVGYCALSNSFDLGASILFSIVALWQMPHFFAIAIYRLHDYASASIPVLPVVRGIQVTKIHMLFYIAAFIAAAASLSLFGYTGYAYLVVSIALGLTWLMLGIKGFKSANHTRWARDMFRFSLVVIVLLCLMMAIDTIPRK